MSYWVCVGMCRQNCFVLRCFWWPMLDKDTWEFVLHQAVFMAFLPIWCPQIEPQFTSQVWTAFVKAQEAPVRWSSGYDPQSNGQAKRTNQYLEWALCCIGTNTCSWSNNLLWVEYAHNSLTCSATGLPPFEASLGYRPPHHLSILISGT